MKVTLSWPLADCKVFWAIGHGEHTGTFHFMYIILVWNDNFIPTACSRLKSSLCLRYCVLCLCFCYYCSVKLQKGNEIILYRRNTAYLKLLGAVFFTETGGRNLTGLKKRGFSLSWLVYQRRNVEEMRVLLSEEGVKEQLMWGVQSWARVVRDCIWSWRLWPPYLPDLDEQ